MKSSFLAGVFMFAAGGLTIAQAADAGREPAARAMPVLVKDASPVARAGVVTSYADVIEPMQKSVVSVYATKLLKASAARSQLYQQLFPDAPPPPAGNREEGLGSGVIVSPDGYIITNSHVVAGADEIEVLLSDERKMKATIVGSDPKTDIAVIKIDGEKLPIVTLADSDKLRVGDVVFAIGNPLAVGQTVTMGIVSAKGRQVGILDTKTVNGYEDFIQTDAAINLGNSGGALVDAKGRLVGINSAILSTSRSDMGGNIGIGFAVPVNLAARIMENLIVSGTVSRGFLGLNVNPLDATLAEASGMPKDARGLIISNVDEGTPAAKAGLRAGDVIVSFDNRDVSTEGAFKFMIAEKAPESLVPLKYFRDGKENIVEVKLGRRADDNTLDNLLCEGVSVASLTDESRRDYRLAANIDGLLVTAVDPASPYAAALQDALVILTVEQTPATDLAKAKGALHPGPNKILVLRKGGATSWIGLTIKAP